MRVVDSARGPAPARSTKRGAKPRAPSATTPSSSERTSPRAKHIEVQILGDRHGNVLHLHERDCSVQRRHQKVVEVAPGDRSGPEDPRRACATPRSRWRATAGYDNAGTVEFLVDADTGEWFFIEVNPRIQVEHTVTEMITGIDLVRAQIQIAQGLALHGPEMDMPPQDESASTATRMQCRITTEDPANNFMPDYGRILDLPLAGRLRHPAGRRHRPTAARSSRRSTIRCW